MDERPIGLFDSGVGGLTIWRAARRLLPDERLIMLADSGNAPYGTRPADEVQDLAAAGVARLLRLDVKLVVVACNTATVTALAHLRQSFPEVPFVGVVPVVKTLARRTRTGAIGVLCTPATAESAYLAGLIEQFAPSLRVVTVACDGLVERIEQGETRSPRVRELLEGYVAPLRAAGVDAVGLGCTHYPFVRPTLKRMLGPDVRVYDPARPVARRMRQVLAERDALAPTGEPMHRFLTTGDAAWFGRVVRRLLRLPAGEVEHVDLARRRSALCCRGAGAPLP